MGCCTEKISKTENIPFTETTEEKLLIFFYFRSYVQGCPGMSPKRHIVKKGLNMMNVPL
jgi:hypothetical protein